LFLGLGLGGSGGAVFSYTMRGITLELFCRFSFFFFFFNMNTAQGNAKRSAKQTEEIIIIGE